MKNTTTTLDALIAQLQDIRSIARFGGDTPVYICIQNVPYQEIIEEAVLSQDSDGSIALIRINQEFLCE